ncbi:MAG TPA: DMT family transporter [Firmicutes bacterium]|nr:DMT family transporter [Bacillota bacterium]
MKTKKDIMFGCLCAVGCESLFGLSYIFTKNATETTSVFALLGWRFLIALISMSICAVTGLIKIHLRRRNILPLISIALCSPIIYYIGETFGIKLTTASESGTFLACIPVASVVASTLILRKKPTKCQVTGIIITLMGVLITVFAAGGSTSFSMIGYGALFLAVIGYALYSVFVEKAKEYSGAEVTFIMLALGATVFSVCAITEGLFEGSIDTLLLLPFTDRWFLITVLYEGIVCSVLATSLSNIAISKIGVNRASSFLGIATVVSILSGILILHEDFSLLQLLGAFVIISGVYTANARKIK